MRSTTETSGVGTRKAMPVSLPFSAGSTLPTALAALSRERGTAVKAGDSARRRHLVPGGGRDDVAASRAAGTPVLATAARAVNGELQGGGRWAPGKLVQRSNSGAPRRTCVAAERHEGWEDESELCVRETWDHGGAVLTRRRVHGRHEALHDAKVWTEGGGKPRSPRRSLEPLWGAQQHSRSWMTLASGARQFVVQDAFETTWCFAGSYVLWLTPMTNTGRGGGSASSARARGVRGRRLAAAPPPHWACRPWAAPR